MATAGAASSSNVVPYTFGAVFLFCTFLKTTPLREPIHKKTMIQKNLIGTHQLTQREYGGTPWWPEEEAHRVGGGGCRLKARG